MSGFLNGDGVLITGGGGFIGHHFVAHFARNSRHPVAVIDKPRPQPPRLDRLGQLEAADRDQVRIFHVDIREKIPDATLREVGQPKYIIHLGGETDVEYSILQPRAVIETNTSCAQTMIELTREMSPAALFYFSTDEVFGPAPDGVAFKEDDRHAPSNPYAASKSAAEMLCMAARRTYELPIVITRCNNVFGERQSAHRFIPKVVRSVIKGDVVPIYAHPGRSKAGSRFYTYVGNVIDAYAHLIAYLEAKKSWSGEFHIIGEREIDNLEVANMIARILGRPLRYDLIDFHEGRPGHDLRYALTAAGMAEIGWESPRNFDETLETTVAWYVRNQDWLCSA